MNDEKYWNNTYTEDLKKYKADFLEDNWMEKYKDIICKVNNKNAIDIGCGLGQDTNWLMKNGFKVISCDISSVALNKLKDLYPDAETMRLDVSDGLPFKDASFGLINANLSLHYFTMQTTNKIFEDIKRVLTPQGLFIGRMNSTKNDYVNSNSKEIEKNFYFDTHNGKYSRLFDKEQFDELFSNWKVLVLKETETVRLERKKYTWEFIVQNNL